MARYIKANRKVANYLHLENDRLQLKDGNYILWQGDMLAFGPLPLLNDTLAQIGGIALMPHEAKQEQDGSVVRPLPVATDERFIMVEPEQQEETAEQTSEEETDTETGDEGQAQESVEAETVEEPQPEAEETNTDEAVDTTEEEVATDEAEGETETTEENPDNTEEE